jgi:hypothetical protein
MTADHETYDELAVGWALHALEPEDEADFAAHLPGCQRCARTVADTAEVMAALAADLPVAEPSADAGRRLRAAVARTEQVSPAAAPVPPVPDDDGAGPASGGPLPPEPAPWRRVVPVALAAAAVALILGLGTWNVVLAQARDRLESTVAEQAAVTEALLRPGRATVAQLQDAGRPVATVVARDAEVQLVTHGLAMNDADATTYVLWGAEGQTMVPIGTFDVVRSHVDVLAVGSGQTGLDAFSGYGISRERGREAPPAPTEIVAIGEVTR